MADNDVTKMKVADLKKELKLRGLPTNGNKTELIEKLQAALIDGDSALDDSVLNGDDILDEDVLDDDELDEEETKSLDSHHEDAVLKTPPESVKSKSPDALSAETTHKKVVLKRKLALITISGVDNTSTTSSTGEVNNDKTTTSSITKIVGPDTASDGTEATDKKLVKLSEVSAKERLEMRAKKFGTPIAPEAKKMARSERFGIKTTDTNVKGSSGTKAVVNETSPQTVEILKKRAERFGGSVSQEMNKIENLEKLQKRQARFGGKAAESAPATVKVSAEASAEFAEKARLRLDRFKPAAVK